jgi:predicted enzyme related to lactoylglutathione lyase
MQTVVDGCQARCGNPVTGSAAWSVVGEYGFIAIAQDTEGNTIGLHSHA